MESHSQTERDGEDALAFWHEELRGLCMSKAEEFALLGYEQVSPDEIWRCVTSRYKAEPPALHQLVNDVLSLKATRFMNWAMVSAYKES